MISISRPSYRRTPFDFIINFLAKVHNNITAVAYTRSAVGRPRLDRTVDASLPHTPPTTPLFN